MDCRIVFFLAVAVTSCLCVPNPEGSWKLEPKCPCGKIYLPVCDNEGRTYSNECEFDCAANFYEKVYKKQLHISKYDECNENAPRNMGRG